MWHGIRRIVGGVWPQKDCWYGIAEEGNGGRIVLGPGRGGAEQTVSPNTHSSVNDQYGRAIGYFLFLTKISYNSPPPYFLQQCRWYPK